MKKSLLALVSFLFSWSISGQISPNIINDIDRELSNLLEDRKAVGLAVAITDKDGILYTKGYGYKDLETQEPVTPQTLFAIGSCTKAFTSALLGQLEGEGLLSFDDSPRDHIPYFSFYNAEMNNHLTIQDMMCHRTGLPRHDLSWYLFPTNSKKELIKRIAHHEPSAGIREIWQYNNFMFLAQGVIAEEITDKSWEENIEDRFFTPLEMKNAKAYLPEDFSGLNKASGYMLDNDEIKGLPDYKIKGMGPAGSIYSSVEEMSNWVQAWLNRGKFKGREIFPETYYSQAITSKMVVSQNLPSAKNPNQHFGNYGYGWFMSSYKGHYLVQHGGNIDGFSARTTFFPSDSLGFIVLVNQNGSDIPSIATQIMADRVLGLEKSPWEKRKKEAEKQAKEEPQSARIEGTTPSHPLANYTGIYEHPGYGKAEILLDSDSLYVVTPLKKYFLAHYHYDVFSPYEIEEDGSIDMDDESPFKFNFRSNDAGKIASFTLPVEATLSPIEFERIPVVLEVGSEALNKYTGTYILGNMEAKVYTKNEELKLFVPGQPEYTLLPTEMHEFTIEGLNGFSLVFEEEEGKINAVSFHQPNGIFKATKKD